MELKSTIFAALMIAIITWRNARIANLDGKKYRPYGLSELGDLAPSTFGEFMDILRKKKKAKNK